MTSTTEVVSLDATRAAAAAAYAAQAEILRGLRDGPANGVGPEFEAAKQKLRDLRRELDLAKKAYEDATAADAPESEFNREDTEILLRRRFFITPSFEIYGGVGGLYDYGPAGMLSTTSVCVTQRTIALIRPHPP
jgi:hypothetical protein